MSDVGFFDPEAAAKFVIEYRARIRAAADVHAAIKTADEGRVAPSPRHSRLLEGVRRAFEELGLDEQKVIAEAKRADANLRAKIAARLVIRGQVQSASDLLGYQIDRRGLARPARVLGGSGYRARVVNKRKRCALNPVIHNVDKPDQELSQGFDLGLLDGEGTSEEAQLGHQLIGRSVHREAPVSDIDEPATPSASPHRLSETPE